MLQRFSKYYFVTVRIFTSKVGRQAKFVDDFTVVLLGWIMYTIGKDILMGGWGKLDEKYTRYKVYRIR